MINITIEYSDNSEELKLLFKYFDRFKLDMLYISDNSDERLLLGKNIKNTINKTDDDFSIKDRIKLDAINLAILYHKRIRDNNLSLIDDYCNGIIPKDIIDRLFDSHKGYKIRSLEYSDHCIELDELSRYYKLYFNEIKQKSDNLEAQIKLCSDMTKEIKTNMDLDLLDTRIRLDALDDINNHLKERLEARDVNSHSIKKKNSVHKKYKRKNKKSGRGHH